MAWITGCFAKQGARYYIKNIFKILTMKDANFYAGVYKAIAVAICMTLFMFVSKAKACEKNKDGFKIVLTQKS